MVAVEVVAVVPMVAAVVPMVAAELVSWLKRSAVLVLLLNSVRAMVLAVEQASCGGTPQPASPDAAGEMLTRWAPGRIVWQSPSRRGPGFWSDLKYGENVALESNRLNEQVFQALYTAFAHAPPRRERL